MKQELAQAVAAAVQKLFGEQVEVVLARPDEGFGDFSTNIAMQLAGKLNKNPREIAEALANELRGNDQITKVEVAGPGFLNLTVDDMALWQSLSAPAAKPLDGQVIVAEYSDPNPFKVLHAGHLYTSVVGDAIANLLEHSGGQVHRVNYGGDVGMHVGKTLWAILKQLGGEHPEKLAKVPETERAAWMADAYVAGNNKYDEDEAAKTEMVELNKKVYAFHADKDHASPLAQIYWTCRKWSYEYFDAFYARIGSHFEKYYPESETAGLGLETVKSHIPAVFQESAGAVIFKGDDHGLHTRVFINSEGLPTYEAKEVGLVMLKKRDYNFDKSVIITGNEQAQYMAVVMKAIEQFAPELAAASTHLTHGLVKLAGGIKMSSRKGNILRAVDVLDAAAEANKQATGKDDEKVTLGAVKYAFLKQRTGGDIVYDPAESVALEGNSGPYLQYAHARAKSILSKTMAGESEVTDLQPGERSLVRKLSEYTDVVEQATTDLMPHLVCTYLYELSQVFNRFYEQNRVVDDARESQRAVMVAQYADTLNEGLGLLGIHAPDKM